MSAVPTLAEPAFSDSGSEPARTSQLSDASIQAEGTGGALTATESSRSACQSWVSVVSAPLRALS
jgi:hypothetical protein